METHWLLRAEDQLLRARQGRPAWGYRPETEPCVEPSALAGLALVSLAEGSDHGPATAAAHWLTEIQQPDGSIGVSASLPHLGWGTPYALLLWAALSSYSEQRTRAVEWLLQCQGKTQPRQPDAPWEHDPSIPGWPWIAGTHSWLEPTAMAILALKRAGPAGHRRVRLGLRLIRDREIPTGGWNFGNTVVFGKSLRPQPGPTGLALLALAHAEGDSQAVDRGCRYLEEILPKIRSLQTLCWALLGLQAWGRRPAAADRWCAEAYRAANGRWDSPMQLACLLLAASGHSLGVLGIEPAIQK